jgi:hypothetical protein
MSEVVHHHHPQYPDDTDDENNNNNNVSNRSGRSHISSNNQGDLAKYNYMCDDCGEAFYSLDEYIEHYKHYHPRSIGTAIT